MKNSRGGGAGRSFLVPFVLIQENVVSKFLHKIFFLFLRDIIGLENFLLPFS